jgi:hypothetical protein
MEAVLVRTPKYKSYISVIYRYFAMDSSTFSDLEIRSIDELRHRLRDLTDHEYAVDYLDEQSTLWRYVLAKSREENPLDQSETMFRESIAWRKDITIRELVREWRSGDAGQPLSARAKFGELCFYGKLLPQRSVRGGPILVERLGKLDLQGLYGDECNLAPPLNPLVHLFFLSQTRSRAPPKATWCIWKRPGT